VAVNLVAVAVLALTAGLCFYVSAENRAGECWACASKHGSGAL